MDPGWQRRSGYMIKPISPMEPRPFSEKSSEHIAENVSTHCSPHCLTPMFDMVYSYKKSCWTRGGVRQRMCDYEKPRRGSAPWLMYTKWPDNPEEALSPIASGKLSWMVVVCSKPHAHNTHPEAQRPQFKKLPLECTSSSRWCILEF